MTASVNMQKVIDWAKNYDLTLRADDPRFGGAVFVSHEDGSFFHFNYAFIVRRKSNNQKWICVFTEHHSFHIYSVDEVKVTAYREKP